MAQVRRAGLSDADDIAAVHVASWETTYRNLLPPEFIAERSFAVRAAFWRDRLGEGNPRIPIFVACEADGAICGFASGGPERTGQLGVDGELYSLYLLDESKGSGTGRALVDAVLEVLREQGMQKVAVWVLGINPARGFYERLGGKWLAERDVEMGGEWFTEVAYELGTN